MASIIDRAADPDALPLDFLRLLFARLNPRDLCAAACTCKLYNELASAPVVWKAHFRTRWRHSSAGDADYAALQREEKWKSLYRIRHKVPIARLVMKNGSGLVAPRNHGFKPMTVPSASSCPPSIPPHHRLLPSLRPATHGPTLLASSCMSAGPHPSSSVALRHPAAFVSIKSPNRPRRRSLQLDASARAALCDLPWPLRRADALSALVSADEDVVDQLLQHAAPPPAVATLRPGAVAAGQQDQQQEQRQDAEAAGGGSGERTAAEAGAEAGAAPALPPPDLHVGRRYWATEALAAVRKQQAVEVMQEIAAARADMPMAAFSAAAEEAAAGAGGGPVLNVAALERGAIAIVSTCACAS